MIKKKLKLMEELQGSGLNFEELTVCEGDDIRFVITSKDEIYVVFRTRVSVWKNLKQIEEIAIPLSNSIY